MPVKISTRKLKLKKLLPDARSYWARELKKKIVDIIVEKITSGRSPVKGQNNYKSYSEAYAKYKGRKQPVDMVDTGSMLNSLKAKQRNDNRTVVIEFTGRDNKKIARYHDNGEGNNPQRKLLPSRNGEEFKQDIMRKIVKEADKAIKNAIKKQK